MSTPTPTNDGREPATRPPYDACVGKLLFALFIVGIAGLGFAFMYQPRGRNSRLGRLGQRIRVVAYAYVAALLISAALRIAGWGI